jgi:hypothetical protein
MRYLAFLVRLVIGAPLFIAYTLIITPLWCLARIGDWCERALYDAETISEWTANRVWDISDRIYK